MEGCGIWHYSTTTCMRCGIVALLAAKVKRGRTTLQRHVEAQRHGISTAPALSGGALVLKNQQRAVQPPIAARGEEGRRSWCDVMHRPHSTVDGRREVIDARAGQVLLHLVESRGRQLKGRDRS
mgnify:CR=1 FL=1